MGGDEDTQEASSNENGSESKPDIEEWLRQCLEKQNQALEKQNETAKANADAIRQLSEAMTRLAPAANDAEARKAKFEKLYLLWLKPTKTKEFRQADDVDVGNWLLQFDATVKSLASGACGLD